MCKFYRTLYLSAEGLTSLPYVKYVDVLTLDYIVDLFYALKKNKKLAKMFINAPRFESVKNNRQIEKLKAFAKKKQSLDDSQTLNIAKAIVRKIALAATNATKVHTKILTKDLLPLFYHTQELILDELVYVEKSAWPNDLQIPQLVVIVKKPKTSHAAVPFIAALSQNTLDKIVISGDWHLLNALFDILYRHRKSLRSIKMQSMGSGASCEERAPREFPLLETCELELKQLSKGRNIYSAVSLMLNSAPNLRSLKIPEVPGSARPLVKLLPSLKLNHLCINATTLSPKTLDAIESQADTLTRLTLSLNEEANPSSLYPSFYFNYANLGL